MTRHNPRLQQGHDSPDLTTTDHHSYDPASQPEHEPIRDRIERVTVDIKDLKQFYSIDISPTRYHRLHDFYTTELASLRTSPFETYDQQSKVDYILLQNYLKRCIRQLDLSKNKDEATSELLPFAKTIIQLCEARQKAAPVDSQLVARVMRDVAGSAKLVTDAIRNGKMNAPREVAYRASNTLKQLEDHLREWYGFRARYDPMFTWWVQAEFEGAKAALNDLTRTVADVLVSTEKGSASDIIGERVGREGLMAELEAEMLCYTPEELIQIAESEERWCLSELRQASQELGFKDDWHSALEHVKKQYVSPGQQTQLVNELLAEGIAFVKNHDLVTVPLLAEETWRMFMLSPEDQKASPFFLGGDSMFVAYPTDAMDYDSKLMSMRGNNRHFSRAEVFHEMIPGHHLQFYSLARYRPYRRVFNTPFWVEGGAMQWEYIFWDMGFFDSAQDRIGTLFWRMHRSARILFTMRFHLGIWSPQQCVHYLVEHVGHERSTAEAEVRRSFVGFYASKPLYQAAYEIGALQLYALRRQMVSSGKMTSKHFHDFILKNNMMPIEMVRSLLKNERLERDFVPTWKFYDGIRREASPPPVKSDVMEEQYAKGWS